MKGLIYVLVGKVHVAWKITRIGFRTIGGTDVSTHAFIILKGTNGEEGLQWTHLWLTWKPFSTPSSWSIETSWLDFCMGFVSKFDYPLGD